MKKKSLSAKKINHRLKDQSINSIFKNFEKKLDKKKKYLVAVSGGPDSLALAFLTKTFAKKYKTKFYYYLINHKLRAGSSKEAHNVIKILNNIKVKCKILNWNGKKPDSNIQSIARSNRYLLLVKESNKIGVENIILGHHNDDSNENFFIRLTRGSGLKGLASFKEKSINFNKNFYRPLLNFNKNQLIYITKNIFKNFVNDPSNKDEKFKRTRIRNLIEKLEEEGLDKKKLKLTLDNLRESNEALEFYSNKNIIDNSSFNKRKNNIILNNQFFTQPNEVVLRSITNLILKLNKNYYPPRGKSIIRLIDSLKCGKNVKNQTLGGCIFTKVSETIIISREITK